MKLPHYVKYTDKVAGGNAKGFYVRINPKFKDDKGIHAHEYEHVKQWYTSLPIGLLIWYLVDTFAYGFSVFFIPFVVAWFAIAYGTIKPFRYWSELRGYNAYLREHEYKPFHVDWACNAISSDYGLNVTPEKVRADLLKLKGKRNG